MCWILSVCLLLLCGCVPVVDAMYILRIFWVMHCKTLKWMEFTEEMNGLGHRAMWLPFQCSPALAVTGWQWMDVSLIFNSRTNHRHFNAAKWHWAVYLQNALISLEFLRIFLTFIFFEHMKVMLVLATGVVRSVARVVPFSSARWAMRTAAFMPILC